MVGGVLIRKDETRGGCLLLDNWGKQTVLNGVGRGCEPINKLRNGEQATSRPDHDPRHCACMNE